MEIISFIHLDEARRYHLQVEPNPIKIQPWFSFDLNDLERPKWEFKKNVMG